MFNQRHKKYNRNKKIALKNKEQINHKIKKKSKAKTRKSLNNRFKRRRKIRVLEKSIP
jgi:hypothetical protein